MTQPPLAYLLELRLKMRGNPEGLAIVDRCLAMVARAEAADALALEALHREVARLGEDLARRFGPPETALRH